MALMPKRVKFRKQQRGSRRGTSYKGSSVAFGEFGLQTLESAWMTDRQIEAARVALMKVTRRGGKTWVRVFPDKPVTKKPAETRMGKGKGVPEKWVAVIKKGRVLFELEGIPEELARDALRLASHKLPFRTKLVSRRHA